jgi:YggT family protein
VNAFLHAFDVTLGALKAAFFWVAVLAAVLCGIEWGVRTRRINPFSRFAQTIRRLMAPVMAPVERMVVRAGGSPSSAAWWTLVALVVGGIVVLSLLGLVRDELGGVAMAAHSGPRGIVRLVFGWAFDAFYIAIIVRVISSWVQINQFGPFVRWSFVVTEPLLRPLRRFLVFGVIDFSPIGAWLLLSWVVQPILMKIV